MFYIATATAAAAAVSTVNLSTWNNMYIVLINVSAKLILAKKLILIYQTGENCQNILSHESKLDD